MNGFVSLFYFDFTLCLMFAHTVFANTVSTHTNPEDQVENLLPSRYKEELYFRITTTTNPEFVTSTTENIILTDENKSRSRKRLEDIFGTPASSLQKTKSSTPIEIPQYILNSVFGPKFGTPSNDTSTNIIKKTRDSQNSTDTSNIDDRFMSAGFLKFLYKGPENHINGSQLPENHINGSQVPENHINGSQIPENHINGSQVPENHINGSQIPENHINGSEVTENHQGLITKRPTTIEVQNDKKLFAGSTNAANFNLISGLLILFEYVIVFKIF